MRAYTNLKQSQELAKILSPESADMGWNVFVDGSVRCLPNNDWDLHKDGSNSVKFIPCWSLAALLDILELPTLEKNGIGKGKTGWMVTHYDVNGMRYDTTYYDNAIDACYEMILKLHEQNIL